MCGGVGKDGTPWPRDTQPPILAAIIAISLVADGAMRCTLLLGTIGAPVVIAFASSIARTFSGEDFPWVKYIVWVKQRLDLLLDSDTLGAQLKADVFAFGYTDAMLSRNGAAKP